MQPETKEKPDKEQNGRQYTHAEQWDQVAFQLIQIELAPNGYKQITNGAWRGLRIANTSKPGLVKSQVGKCQNIAAQMVRTFRGQAQRAVQEELKIVLDQLEQAKANYKATPFWKFRKKKRFYRLANSYAGYVEAYQEVMGILLQLPIK